MVHLLTALVVVVFPVLTVYAAVTDFFSMTIANRVSIALAAAGVVALLMTGTAPTEIGWHLAAAALVFAIGFTCFAFGWMGGGDVKFAAAIALWLGWAHLLEWGLWVGLWGGALTVLVLLSGRLLDPLPVLKIGFLGRFHEHRRVPYGIALTAAALQVFVDTPWLRILI